MSVVGGEGVGEQGDAFELEVAGAGQSLAQSGRAAGERERGEVVVVDVWFDGEEGVVAAGVVPVLGSGAERADPSRHRFVGGLREGEGGVRVGADEDDGGAGGVGLVAGVREAPAAQEGVVGEELVVVVGGAGGEVKLDQQVEGEVDRGDPQLERRCRA